MVYHFLKEAHDHDPSTNQRTVFSSVEHIVSDISQYAVHPDSDFKRSKKIPAQKLISFLISQGSSSTRVEMLDFWGLDSSIPTASALSQQRAKLKPDALEAVFRHFNSASMELPPASLYGFALPFPETLMALPALFSALRLSHHQTTTVDRHDVLDGIKMSISVTVTIALIITWHMLWNRTVFPVPYQGYPFQRTGRQF
ncbi:MAG: hypothetical protein ACLVE7_02260 [Coprococcus comes]